MGDGINLNKMDPQVNLYEPVEITVAVPKNQPPKINTGSVVEDDLSSFPDRIIAQEDVRLFTIKANLYRLSDKSSSEPIELKNVAPVEVLDVEGRTLGYATIFQEKNYVTCDARIEYHSPERLSIQNNLPYYLIPYGDITYKETKSNSGALEIQSLDIKKLILANDAQASTNLWRVSES